MEYTVSQVAEKTGYSRSAVSKFCNMGLIGTLVSNITGSYYSLNDMDVAWVQAYRETSRSDKIKRNKKKKRA